MPPVPPPAPPPTPPPAPLPPSVPAPQPQPPSGGGGTSTWIGDAIAGAIEGFFRDIITSALQPLLDLLGATLLSTPTPSELPYLGELWEGSRAIAVSGYVLLISVAGLIVAGYQTVQNRYSLREVAPRLVIGFIAANLSLWVSEQATILSNALARAILGNAVDPDTAPQALQELITYGLTDGELWLVFLALALPVLLVLLLITYAIRITLDAMLIVGAPLALAFHGLPQTEGAAYWWWRAFGAVLGVQLGQALALAVGLRVILTPGGFTLGAGDAQGWVGLLLLIGLLIILVKIPFWALSAVRVGRSRSIISSITRIWVASRFIGTLGGTISAGRASTGGGASATGRSGGRGSGGGPRPHPGPPPGPRNGPSGGGPQGGPTGGGSRGGGPRGSGSTRHNRRSGGPPGGGPAAGGGQAAGGPAGVVGGRSLYGSGMVDPYVMAGRTTDGQYTLPLPLRPTPTARPSTQRTTRPAPSPPATARPPGPWAGSGGEQLALPIAPQPPAQPSARTPIPPGRVGGVRTGAADPFRGQRRGAGPPPPPPPRRPVPPSPAPPRLAAVRGRVGGVRVGGTDPYRGLRRGPGDPPRGRPTPPASPAAPPPPPPALPRTPPGAALPPVPPVRPRRRPRPPGPAGRPGPSEGQPR